MGESLQKTCGCSHADKSQDYSKSGVIKAHITELDSFKSFLPMKWKSRSEAFREVSDLSNSIDQLKFQQLFIEYHDGNVNDVFNILDVKKEGFIRKADLRKLVRSAVLDEDRSAKGKRRSTSEELVLKTKSDHDEDASPGGGSPKQVVPRKRLSEMGTSSTSGKVEKQNLRKAHSAGDVNTVEPGLLNFQVYFYRRPLRVQKAFANLGVAGDDGVDLKEFSKFVKEQLQYSGDAEELFDELIDTVDSRVTWGGVKALLERPWPIGDG